jgi:hypothetical protein
MNKSLIAMAVLIVLLGISFKIYNLMHNSQLKDVQTIQTASDAAANEANAIRNRSFPLRGMDEVGPNDAGMDTGETAVPTR